MKIYFFYLRWHKRRVADGTLGVASSKVSTAKGRNRQPYNKTKYSCDMLKNLEKMAMKVKKYY